MLCAVLKGNDKKDEWGGYDFKIVFILEESQLSFPFVYYRPLCIFKDLRQAYPWSLKTTNKSVLPWSRFLTHFVLAHLLCKEVDSSE